MNRNRQAPLSRRQPLSLALSPLLRRGEREKNHGFRGSKHEFIRRNLIPAFSPLRGEGARSPQAAARLDVCADHRSLTRAVWTGREAALKNCALESMLRRYA